MTHIVILRRKHGTTYSTLAFNRSVCSREGHLVFLIVSSSAAEATPGGRFEDRLCELGYFLFFDLQVQFSLDMKMEKVPCAGFHHTYLKTRGRLCVSKQNMTKLTT